MTCIVGIQSPEGVVIGGDYLYMDGKVSHSLDQGKVFTNGDFLLGLTGSARVSQVLRHIWQPPKFGVDRNQSLQNFIHHSIPQSILGILSINGCNDQTFDLIFGFRGKLYVLMGDASIRSSSSPDWYDAIGIGTAPALGSLFTSGELKVLDKMPKARVELALLAASKVTPMVQAPFTILHQGLTQ